MPTWAVQYRDKLREDGVQVGDWPHKTPIQSQSF